MGAELALVEATAQLLGPLAREWPLIRMAQARPEALFKQLLQRPRVDRPSHHGGGVLLGMGAVPGVVGIKDEQRLLAIEAAAGRFIQAADRQLPLAAEGVMAGDQPEDQHRQGEQVAAGTRFGLPEQHFRGHEARGAQHGAAPLAVDVDVVVIADQHPAAAGLQKQIAQGDVLVTEPLEVQVVEAIRQVETGPQHVLETDLQLAAGVLMSPHEARWPQGHQVADPGLGVAD